ncbi:hypothetical protein AAFP30_05020 [Gordonia sp. CPCC 205515]|uniref:hypothetical protein n=1 Tax=Gordonia sp. CPCC 205515 TaxID=3140791 RepID=UPI003AF3BDEE
MSQNPHHQAPPVDPRTRPEHAVVVCGTAGGVGTSVVAAMLAEHRAATTLGPMSWWVDAAGNDGDLELRLRGQGDPELLRTTAGTGLWLPPDDATVPDAIVESWRLGGVPVVDAGARSLSVLPDLVESELAHVTPILVVGPRPDLLNRARIIFTEWDRVGLLQSTIVVICCQVPTLNHEALTQMLKDTVTGQVAGVVGLDYDPVLGAGTALDRGAQQAFSPGTHAAFQALAAATTDAR